MGSAVCRDDHTAAEVGDFEGDALWIFAKDDLRALAAGVALDVGKTLLSDAEESGFGNLGKAAKTGEEFERGFDAAAFAETVDVFLEGRDEAEAVAERRTAGGRGRATVAGHWREEAAGVFVRAATGFAAPRGGLGGVARAAVVG